MKRSLPRWPARKRTISLLMALAGVSLVAYAKTYTCECSITEGSTYSEYSYVAEGKGCCDGAIANGSALYTKRTGGKTERGYTDPAEAQTACCDRHLEQY